MDFRLQPLQTHHSEQAALALWHGFSDKIGKILSPKASGLRLLADWINPDRGILALDGQGDVIGIAGYDLGDGGIITGGISAMFRHFGIFGGMKRAICFEFISRTVEPDAMYIDSIVVFEHARGHGVATALIAKLSALAKDHGKTFLALDVIDENASARALYERLGFRVVRTQNSMIRKHLFGFSKSHYMRMDL